MLKDLTERSAGGPQALGRLARELAGNLADPRAKLFVVARALGCRRELPDVFGKGGYVPVEAAGEKAAHVFAFLRHHGTTAALAVAPRLPAGLVPEGSRPPVGRDVWGDTVLSLPEGFRAGRWENVFTGEALAGDSLALGEVLGAFPVALLVRPHPE
jgi:(1->4)-alpha-D-glucan 1-alpha-D-glucosylmutase